MGKKIKSNYKQIGKIGDEVLQLDTGEIGIIKKINNLCNLKYNNRSVNEYYVKWDHAWTRHDCYYIDNRIPDPGNKDNPAETKVEFILLTGTAKVLYGKKNT